MDRNQLADFLRTRREALQPEDVGLPRGQRRRTGGLRREEVAALCGMSTDYYSRIEQQRGSRPSEPMLAAIARGLHLSLDERDHLFRLAGHPTPASELRLEHVDAGLMRVLDRLQDTPAQRCAPEPGPPWPGANDLTCAGCGGAAEPVYAQPRQPAPPPHPARLTGTNLTGTRRG